MKCDDGACTKSLTEVEPHDYVPSALHMGDCAICGHVADAPIHRFADNREIARLMCMVREQTGEITELTDENRRLTRVVDALVPFLALWAAQYARDHLLDGLHPQHYDLLVKAGARMEDFHRATNEPVGKSGMRSEG